MVFCGPHLPLAFQFVCGPPSPRAANKLEGKWKVSLCLVAPPQAAAEYDINSSICWRTTFEDICQPLGNDSAEAPTREGWRTRLNKCKVLQIRGFCGTVFPPKVGISKAITCIWDNTADIGAILKDFGLVCEERKTEITMKTECRKNGPIICKDKST